MQESSKFCERLSRLMIEENLSADKLGKIINVGGSTIRQWRAGTRNPTLSNAILLANNFKCSIDFLAGRIDYDGEYIPKPTLPFYERLKYILDEHGVTWYRVAKDTKTSLSSLHTWHKGSQPLLHTVVELAKYLDISIDYLIGREN